jgi:hypothetical protein
VVVGWTPGTAALEPRSRLAAASQDRSAFVKAALLRRPYDPVGHGIRYAANVVRVVRVVHANAVSDAAATGRAQPPQPRTQRRVSVALSTAPTALRASEAYRSQPAASPMSGPTTMVVTHQDAI